MLMECSIFGFITTTLENRIQGAIWKIMHKRSWLVVVISIWISHAKSTHVQSTIGYGMLHEKALEAFRVPDLRRSRILNHEVPAMFDLEQSNTNTKFYHGQIFLSLLICVCRIVDILHVRPWSTDRCHMNDFWSLSLYDFHGFSPAFGCRQVVTSRNEFSNLLAPARSPCMAAI